MNFGISNEDPEPPPQQEAALTCCVNRIAAPRTGPQIICLRQDEEDRYIVLNGFVLWQGYREGGEVVGVSNSGCSISSLHLIANS